VSVDSSGGEANYDSWTANISADGRVVVFTSEAWNLVSDDTNDMLDVFAHDCWTGETIRVSVSSDGEEGDFDSGSIARCPAVSGDGRHVAFESAATNLVPGDTNGWNDIFVYDRETHRTRRVSISSSRAQANNDCAGPSISFDGHCFAFSSEATNLVVPDFNWASSDVYVHRVSTDRLHHP
jgi:Tol biopolymer transport system component